MRWHIMTYFLLDFTAPVVFLFLCAVLMELRCSRRAALGVGLAFILAEFMIQSQMAADEMLMMTLLPLTLYLPAVLLIHLLSANSFLSTCCVWLTSTLAIFILQFLRKLLEYISGSITDIWIIYLLSACLLSAAAVCVLRKPFQLHMRKATIHHVGFLFPILMSMALLSYFLNAPSEVVPLILALCTALAVVVLLSWLLLTYESLQMAAERETAIQLQMAAQQWSYEAACEKLEAGRAYRHDMRHHLMVLNELLHQNETGLALEYVHTLDVKLTNTQQEVYCNHLFVNVLLTAYFAQAVEAGCKIRAEVNLPDELPFNDQDLCVLLANALENAIHACQQIPPEEPREIVFTASFSPKGPLMASVENTCARDIVFQSDGFPASAPTSKNHGIGLRSIESIVKKYNGLMNCGCKDRRFTLQLVLFQAIECSDPPVRKGPRAVFTTMAALALCCFFLNCSPALANYLETIPLIGEVVQIVNLRKVLYWGGQRITVEQPSLESSGAGLISANDGLEAYIDDLEEEFLYYVSRRFNGYTNLDVSYTVLRNDSALLMLQIDGTINIGGSVHMRRHFIVDKQSGQLLALPDLFLPDVNYQFPISREIKAQMEEQIRAGTGDYFLPGGIWPEEECFQSISEDQDFYLNGDHQLVIAFDEYTIAPGSMGMPEFVIPTDLLDGLLARPGLLQ